MKNPRMLEKEGVKCPVVQLQKSLNMYEQMGRKKDMIKIQKIKEALLGR